MRLNFFFVGTLGKFHKRAVTSVAFSADGKWCGSVGADNDHSVALWGSRTGQWSDGKLLTTCRGDPGKTLFLAFAGDAQGDFNFVTGGVSHIRFWQVSGTQQLLIEMHFFFFF